MQQQEFIKTNWSINKIAVACGMDRRTVARILESVELSGRNGDVVLYSLSSFVAALRADCEVKGDPEFGGPRLTASLAAAARNAVIETSTVLHVWENVSASIRRTIETSPLPTGQKDSIFAELRALKLQDFLEQREFDQGQPAEDEAAG